MAVLKETEGRGPFASLVMAVVIVKDVVVFVCFAINIEMADAVSLAVIPSVSHRGLPYCSPQSCRLNSLTRLARMRTTIMKRCETLRLLCKDANQDIKTCLSRAGDKEG